jgi:two-component system cell cycle response regulator CpdR
MPRRALVADDDPLALELIASMLEELGCETLTARSGRDALRLLASQKVDILVADINMPGLSGIELGRRGAEFPPWNPGSPAVGSGERWARFSRASETILPV